MEFSGKELIKGEPDASSFPSGGLRATFEARGYTAWDPTSYAFIKDRTLCIPTAFCSYGGEALDKKTPLLRSMEALNNQAVRILKLFGNDDVNACTPPSDPSRNTSLSMRNMYDKRTDLIYTGRTLFGAKPPKGQELDDHYFGAIKPQRCGLHAASLNEELWKLGILAKTEHNEVAPAQHELAPYLHHDEHCHRPQPAHHGDDAEGRASVTDWSACCTRSRLRASTAAASTTTGRWLRTPEKTCFDPGETPHENAQFLLFLCAVIKAVDDYQDLLRISVATRGQRPPSRR